MEQALHQALGLIQLLNMNKVISDLYIKQLEGKLKEYEEKDI